MNDQHAANTISWLEKGITILGLGPGDVDKLTRQAWEWLNTISVIYLRTRHHPAVASFPSRLKVESFDQQYDQGESITEGYAEIVERVLALGRSGPVTYGVPGHPFVAEATGPEIARRAREEGIPFRVIEGLSFLEPTFTALGCDPFPEIVLIDAVTLCGAYMPSFPPSQPALIAQISSVRIASEVKLTLRGVYPEDHPVRLVHAAGTINEVVEYLNLHEIDRSEHTGLLTVLYLPPLSSEASLESFQEVVAHLRDPETGCPWDKEQTHSTLRPYLLEETYEALEALDANDPAKMREEFGDLLLQIVLHAQIASETSEFNLAEIVEGINRKIIRRHPHVFGDVQVKGVSGVLRNWEKLKAEERKENGQSEKGLLDSIPKILAALAQAQEYQDRTARVGFDWPEIAPVRAKIMEELEEVDTAPDAESRAKELGDLLFAVVNYVRWFKVDAESALRQTNERFRGRFGYIERTARSQGRSLNDMTLAQMDELWEEAKGKE
jgi:tetrapyrrole methylase family protein / MazG family protein